MSYRLVLTCLLTCATSVPALGGELNPPAGPVAETGRFGPRIEINDVNTPGDIDTLFRIDQPGSYYLGGNVVGVVDKCGVLIDVSGVTIDLMGFELQGVPGSFDGVSIGNSIANVHICNGSVRAWGGVGVRLSGAANSSMRHLFAEGNAGSGLVIGRDGIVESCAARNNGGNGIAGSGGSTFSRSAASFNTLAGISASSGATVSACSAQSNGTAGISASSGSTISGNAARSNTQDGIATGSACTILGNSVMFNSRDGVRVVADCLVLNNTCDNNSAGIHVTNLNNRIEGNNVTDNACGIDVDFSGNLIIRNSASANTSNYDFVAGNAFGPIVNVAGVGDITGVANAEHPWANFEF